MGSRPLRIAIYWLPLAAYCGVIFYLSSKSDPLPGVSIGNFDKVLHFLEYSALAVLSCRALSMGGTLVCGVRAAVYAALFATLYGASDELHQWFVPGRSCDPYDLLTDAIGATVGASAYFGAFLRHAAPRK